SLRFGRPRPSAKLARRSWNKSTLEDSAKTTTRKLNAFVTGLIQKQTGKSCWRFLSTRIHSKFEILAARDFGVHPLSFINHEFKRKAFSHRGPRILRKAGAFVRVIEQRNQRIGERLNVANGHDHACFIWPNDLARTFGSRRDHRHAGSHRFDN